MAAPEAAKTDNPGNSRLRWLMLALVFFLYASFGLTMGTIPPLVGPILTDLNLSYSQMGMVLGAWQLVYIGTAYPLGTMVDRLGVRRSLGIGILVILLSLVFRGLAVDFYTLLLAVALFGVGGPIISIGAPKVVSLWFEGNERGVAVGIYNVGPLLGMVFAFATASSLVIPLTGSWRGISLIYGAMVLLAAVAWWLFAREAPPPTADGDQRGSTAAMSLGEAFHTLLRLRNVQLLLVLAVGSFMLNHGLNNWLPTLLQESGMTLSQAGFWTAIGMASGALGLLVIPGLARHGYRTLAIGLLLALGAGTTVGLALLHGPGLIGVLLLSNVARLSMMPVLILILLETPGVGAPRIGAASGLFFAAAEVGGFSGPLLLGLLRDATGSLVSGVLLLAVVSASMVLMTPLIHERKPKPLRA
ncbi:MAG: MFS transporter [Chloroflexi bacterium]|nr:MFS transporter [Chloroflexota bacterium]